MTPAQAEREASWTHEQLAHVVREIQRKLRYDKLTVGERKILHDQLAFYSELEKAAHQ